MIEERRAAAERCRRSHESALELLDTIAAALLQSRPCASGRLDEAGDGFYREWIRSVEAREESVAQFEDVYHLPLVRLRKEAESVCQSLEDMLSRLLAQNGKTRVLM